MTAQNRPADRLKDLIEEQGWTLSALSMAAGLGKGAVSDLLNHPDRQPREKTLRALAATLGVDLAYLAGRIDHKRATSDLSEGISEARDLLTNGIEGILDTSKGRLRAFHRTGRAGSETIIIDTTQPGESGQMVLTNDDDGAAMRYLAEPYLIAIDAAGGAMHTLKRPETPILGRVLAVIRHF